MEKKRRENHLKDKDEDGEIRVARERRKRRYSENRKFAESQNFHIQNNDAKSYVNFGSPTKKAKAARRESERPIPKPFQNHLFFGGANNNSNNNNVPLQRVPSQVDSPSLFPMRRNLPPVKPPKAMLINMGNFNKKSTPFLPLNDPPLKEVDGAFHTKIRPLFKKEMSTPLMRPKDIEGFDEENEIDEFERELKKPSQKDPSFVPEENVYDDGNPNNKEQNAHFEKAPLLVLTLEPDLHNNNNSDSNDLIVKPVKKHKKHHKKSKAKKDSSSQNESYNDANEEINDGGKRKRKAKRGRKKSEKSEGRVQKHIRRKNKTPRNSSSSKPEEKKIELDENGIIKGDDIPLFNPEYYKKESLKLEQEQKELKENENKKQEQANANEEIIPDDKSPKRKRKRKHSRSSAASENSEKMQQSRPANLKRLKSDNAVPQIQNKQVQILDIPTSPKRRADSTQQRRRLIPRPESAPEMSLKRKIAELNAAKTAEKPKKENDDFVFVGQMSVSTNSSLLDDGSSSNYDEQKIPLPHFPVNDISSSYDSDEKNSNPSSKGKSLLPIPPLDIRRNVAKPLETIAPTTIETKAVFGIEKIPPTFKQLQLRMDSNNGSPDYAGFDNFKFQCKIIPDTDNTEISEMASRRYDFSTLLKDCKMQ